MSERVNIICLKWGTVYPAEYVNRLYAGVKRHLKRPFRFVCFTDDGSELAEGIDAQPIPKAPDNWKHTDWYGSHWPNIYVKLCLFRPGEGGLEGPTLFLDIDQIITGDLDPLFDYKPGEFCIIHNWVELRKRIFRRQPDIGNSSCFRFDAGEKSAYIYQKFVDEMDIAQDRRYFRTEQEYMTHAVGLDKVNWWPDSWIRSFKRSACWPWPLNHFLTPRFPAGTRILCFHGQPNPIDAIGGFKGKHLNTWTLPAPWVEKMWNEG